MSAVIPVTEIQQRIHVVRGKRVIVDADLAAFYGVATKELNQAVGRNIERFPEDFSFLMTTKEARNLKFQFGISSSQHGGTRYVKRVFTEQGVAMLASVLRGTRAAAMSIAIVRAFVQLRELLLAHRELAAKLSELEQDSRAMTPPSPISLRPSVSSWPPRNPIMNAKSDSFAEIHENQERCRSRIVKLEVTICDLKFINN